MAEVVFARIWVGALLFSHNTQSQEVTQEFNEA
jgi:hypothetical protein